MSLPLLTLVGGLAQAAAPAGLTVSVPDGFTVTVDGEAVPVLEGQAVATELTGGRHELALHNRDGKELFHGMVDLPGGYHVLCDTAQWELQCTELLPIVTIAAPLDGPREPRPRDTDLSWGLVRGEEGEAPLVVEPVVEPAVVPERVELVVNSFDGEWTDILVDGRVVIELRNETTDATSIEPGKHRVEVREFMADRSYTWGTLLTGYADQVTLGIRQGDPITCQGCEGWYHEAEAPVGRPDVSALPIAVGPGRVGPGRGDVRTTPEPDASPAIGVPDVVELVLRSRDGEWADVLVDGAVVAEIRNADEAVVTLTPGLHTIEVREFMAGEPYARGRLETGTAARITLGLREGQPIECYDHDGFTPE